MFDAVIFDLDGTLIDTEALAIRSARAVFARIDIPLDEPLFHSLIGRDLASGDAILRAAYPQLDIDRLKTDLHAGFEAELAAGLPLKPGALDLLDQITQPRALCTSSQRASAHRKLDLAGLAQAFAHVVTREDVVAAKPHPEPYLLTAQLLGVDPARCLVFEDSEAGAAAAMAAGCVVVQIPDIIPTQGVHAHHVAPTLIEGARMAGLI